MFGVGRPRALDRNAKVRVMHWASRQFPLRQDQPRSTSAATGSAAGPRQPPPAPRLDARRASARTRLDATDICLRMSG
jgi:hypothetical protein